MLFAQALSNSWQTLNALWARLCVPVGTLTDLEDRHRARLVTSIHLVMGIIVIVASLLRALTNTDKPASAQLWEYGLEGISLVWLLIGYFLSRMGHYRAAIIGSISLGSLAVFAGASVAGGPGMNAFYYLVIMNMFAGIFLSHEQLAVIMVSQLLGMLLWGQFIAGRSANEIIYGPVAFNLEAIVVVLVLTTHHEHLEDVRKRQLAESEARYRYLVEGIDDLVFVIGNSGEILSANNAVESMLGWSREELLGRPIREFIVPEDFQPLQATFAPDAMSGTYEVRALTKPGAQVTLEFRLAPYVVSGKKIGVSGVARDISVRKQAEAQRVALAVERERVQMLRDFIQDISHDLVTPITILSTGLHLLTKITEKDFVQQRIPVLQKQVIYLEQMIQDMLLMIRLEAPNGDEFDFEMLDLDRTLAAILSEHRLIAEKKRQALDFAPGLDQLLVRCDASKFGRAIGNLLSNALHYTPELGRISVTTGLNAAQMSAVIRVSDTGVGIAPNDLPHIFERFYRAQNHRPSEGSLGLGLAIVQKIVEAHGGSIGVESQVDQGTTFTIWLPVHPNKVSLSTGDL